MQELLAQVQLPGHGWHHPAAAPDPSPSKSPAARRKKRGQSCSPSRGGEAPSFLLRASAWAFPKCIAYSHRMGSPAAPHSMQHWRNPPIPSPGVLIPALSCRERSSKLPLCEGRSAFLCPVREGACSTPWGALDVAGENGRRFYSSSWCHSTQVL